MSSPSYILASGAVQSAGIHYGLIVSGSISSGQIGAYYLASGSISSGWHVYRNFCRRCFKVIGRDDFHVDIFNAALPFTASGMSVSFCAACAGWNAPGDFHRREDWIREGSPFVSGTPDVILADWLQEHGREKDADHMRNLKFCS